MKKKFVILALAILAVAAIVTLGNVHLVIGPGFRRPKILRKDRFGFRETWIDLKKMDVQSIAQARARYISYDALKRAGFIIERPNTDSSPQGPQQQPE